MGDSWRFLHWQMGDDRWKKASLAAWVESRFYGRGLLICCSHFLNLGETRLANT